MRLEVMNVVRSEATHVWHTTHVYVGHALGHLLEVVLRGTHSAHLAGSRHDSCGSGIGRRSHVREHESNIHIERSVHLFFSLDFFLLLDIVSRLLHSFDSGGKVFDKLDEVWHNEFLQITSPGHLKSNIGLNQVVARVEHRGKQLLVLHMHDVSHEVLSQNGVVTLGNSLHHVLVELILLGDIKRFLELFVLAVQQSSDSSAFKKVVAFETDSQLE